MASAGQPLNFRSIFFTFSIGTGQSSGRGAIRLYSSCQGVPARSSVSWSLFPQTPRDALRLPVVGFSHFISLLKLFKNFGEINVIHRGLGHTYRGALSEDGNVLTGGWRPDKGTPVREESAYDSVMVRVK